MATYQPTQVGIKPPPGGFQQGAWYGGRQYWNGTLSDPGVIHPSSNQPGAGQLVSQEVNAQSARAQGVTAPQLENYLQQQRQKPIAQPTQPTQPTLGAGTTYTPGTGGAGIANIQGMLPTQQPTINLPDLYKSITKDSGIEQLQQQLQAKEQAYNQAVATINDNPYYSEATRVGRVAKLSDQYQRDVQATRNELATRQADIETQMNLQTKQFDINSQQAKDAMSQFTNLLDIGAFDNASGDDIASITRTTGLSSSMIQNAINARRDKGVETKIIEYDDGTNQGFAVINAKTGDILSRQVVAGSKPTAKEKAGSTSGGGLTDTQIRNVTANARKALQEADANGDKAVSLPEFQQAINKIMTSTGLSQAQAEEYAAQAFADLGYKTWKWSS